MSALCIIVIVLLSSCLCIDGNHHSKKLPTRCCYPAELSSLVATNEYSGMPYMQIYTSFVLKKSLQDFGTHINFVDWSTPGKAFWFTRYSNGTCSRIRHIPPSHTYRQCLTNRVPGPIIPGSTSRPAQQVFVNADSVYTPGSKTIVPHHTMGVTIEGKENRCNPHFSITDGTSIEVYHDVIDRIEDASVLDVDYSDCA